MMASAGRGIIWRQIDRLFREGTLVGLGEGQLLERYLTRRDEAAFEALVDLYGPMVLGLCRRMLRDPRDIEDAFQATFLVLVRKAPAIRDRGLLSSWLYGVAYRVARRARAQTLRRRGREMAVADLEVAAAPETSDRLEVGPMLDQELSRLPEKYRAPLVLCYLRGRTHDQAAEELRCPVGTVRSRLARGRDLLKKRLMRRGYAPTAVILGTSPTVPARLLSTAVPPSMVAATVRAALGFGSSSTIQASAAATSALALAQGVLTTMKLAQLKWIGLAVLATSLSAGGVVAVSYASARSQEAPTAQNSAAVVVHDPQEKAEPRKRPPILLGNLRSDRFEALEKKVDELLRRLDTNPPQDEPIRPIPAPARTEFDARRTSPTTANPIRELEVRLKLALGEFERTEKLFQSGTLPFNVREQARGKALIIAAQLEELDDDLAYEIARLKLEMRRKNAEREKADAQKEVAASVVARNNRLNEQRPGTLSEPQVARAERELKLADAQVAIAAIEAEEVELRIDQLQRRRDRIKKIIALAERVKTP